jgi:hypothetical protein
MSTHVTLSELIEQLQDLQREIEAIHPGQDPLVKVHYQPNYPLRGSVQNVTVLRDGATLSVALAIGEAGGDEPYGDPEAWDQFDSLPSLEGPDEGGDGE